MTEQARRRDSVESLEQALKRLGEALAESVDDNPIAIDGTVQRFEFSIELFWKVLQKLLRDEQVVAKSPRQVMQEAYALGWLKDEALWLEMANARNQTSHTYDEDLAVEIYGKIKKFYPHLCSTFEFLKENVIKDRV
ncbi:MAG: nucleotidyltransferase substrate binding protein [Epsilonproteobacteria bacterium]|nr:nucleotidyltransferase substrate binding protein [Campylobacterota bacterium]